MNKKIILSLFLPILIAACSSPEIKEPEIVIDAPIAKSFVGTVNKLTVPLNNLDADYYLLTDSKNRIYLNSVIHNLENYIDFEVRLKGQILYTDLANKQVEILNVEQIDIISSPEVQLDILSFESAKFGVSFDYLSKFDLEEFSSQVSLSDSNSRQLIKLNFIDKQLSEFTNLDSYIDSLNLDAPRENFVTNNHKFDLYNLSSDTIKYFVESNKYILELTYIFLDSNIDGFTSFDEFLNSIVLSDLEIKEQVLDQENTDDQTLDSDDSIDPSNQDDPNLDLTSESLDSQNIDSESNNQNITDYTQAYKQIQNNDLNSESELNTEINTADKPYLDVIDLFELNTKDYLDSFSQSVSYSFTDNNEFYLIYLDNNDNLKRVLIDYSNSFKIIASFTEGSVADWDLVSGVNIAFDRPLTVIAKEGNDFLPSISLKEGFRLFESLSMEIQNFYPTDWYYSRQGDVYIFSDDPKTFEPSMVLTLLDVSASLPYAELETNESIQVSGNIFVKKLNAGFFKLEFIDNSTDTSYILDSLRDV